jgi:hypothetical protein
MQGYFASSLVEDGHLVMEKSFSNTSLYKNSFPIVALSSDAPGP